MCVKTYIRLFLTHYMIIFLIARVLINTTFVFHKIIYRFRICQPGFNEMFCHGFVNNVNQAESFFFNKLIIRFKQI